MCEGTSSILNFHFLGMISKWEDVSSEIRKGLQQHSELRNISEKIVTITEDLTTLDSIIDDDYDDELEEEDDEVADIKHQLFEVNYSKECIPYTDY